MMGLVDAFARTLAIVTRREPLSYSPPAAKSADSLGDTNADASVQWIRRWNAGGGPARSAAVANDGAGSVPSPNGQQTGSAPSPGRYGAYQPTNAGTVNVHATNGRELPYGLQTSVDRDDI